MHDLLRLLDKLVGLFLLHVKRGLHEGLLDAIFWGSRARPLFDYFLLRDRHRVESDV